MDTPKFLTTGKMAEYIGVSISFLKDNKEKLFKKGVHYFIPPGRSHPLWDTEQMISWVKSNNDTQVDDIIKKVV